MIEIIKELNIEVSKKNVFQAVVAKQYDMNTRFIKATLVDGGEKIYINQSETIIVVINAQRPDGESKGFDGVINDDGTVTVPLHSWMLDVVGTVTCDISVIDTAADNGKKLTTTSFTLLVEKAAWDNDGMTADPQYNLLIELLNDCEAAAGVAATALEKSNEAIERAAGVRGIYVGSGEMPDECSIQIDPSGSAVTVVDDVIKDSKELVTSGAVERYVAGVNEFVEEEIGRVADSLNGKMSVYKSLSSIGLTAGSETIEDIALALPNKSMLFYAAGEAANTEEYPENTVYAEVIVFKDDISRVIFQFISKTTARVWVGVYSNTNTNGAWTGWKKIAMTDDANDTLKTYKSLYDLGINYGDETLVGIFNKMDSNSQLVCSFNRYNNFSNIYPYGVGVLDILKVSGDTGTARFFGENGSTWGCVFCPATGQSYGVTVSAWKKLATEDDTGVDVSALSGLVETNTANIAVLQNASEKYNGKTVYTAYLKFADIAGPTSDAQQGQYLADIYNLKAKEVLAFSLAAQVPVPGSSYKSSEPIYGTQGVEVIVDEYGGNPHYVRLLTNWDLADWLNGATVIVTIKYTK